MVSSGFFSGDTLLGEVDEISDLPSDVQEGLKGAFPSMSEEERLEAYILLKMTGQVQ